MSHADRRFLSGSPTHGSSPDLLQDVLAAIPDAPIYQTQIRNDGLFVFGSHDVTTGAVTMNVPLLRVMVALHELTHRVQPAWSERTVRARSAQLLRALNDDGVAAIDQALLAQIRASR
jgi:hypothetical protein